VIYVEQLYRLRATGYTQDPARSTFYWPEKAAHVISSLRRIRWLPDTSDPLLLMRLQREYERVIDAWYEGYRTGTSKRDVLIAQKRLAQAILALGSTP